MSHRGKRQPTADGSLAAQQGPVAEQPRASFAGSVKRRVKLGRPRSRRRVPAPREWLFAAALVAAVFLAYQPGWQGGFLWDNDTHLLKNPVLTPGGVFRTWVPGSYSNYWPAMSTVYWLQYQFWGLEPVGYHLVNIALHALSAILICAILDWLRVPGALLAAALFALHPVNVQSVAWITQLKNTLSLSLSLLSVLLYLWSEQRGGRWGFSALPVLSPASSSACRAGLLGAQQTRLRRVPPVGPACRAGLSGRDKPGSRQVPPVGPACRAGLLGATDPAAPSPARGSACRAGLSGATNPAAPSPASRSRLPGGLSGRDRPGSAKSRQ